MERQSPLGTPEPEEAKRPERKPWANFSRYAVMGGRIGGLWDAKGAIEARTSDSMAASKLVALVAFGLENSLADKARIEGVRVTVLFEVDGAHRDTGLEVARKALDVAGLPGQNSMPRERLERGNGEESGTR